MPFGSSWCEQQVAHQGGQVSPSWPTEQTAVNLDLRPRAESGPSTTNSADFRRNLGRHPGLNTDVPRRHPTHPS